MGLQISTQPMQENFCSNQFLSLYKKILSIKILTCKASQKITLLKNVTLEKRQ